MHELGSLQKAFDMQETLHGNRHTPASSRLVRWLKWLKAVGASGKLRIVEGCAFTSGPVAQCKVMLRSPACTAAQTHAGSGGSGLLSDAAYAYGACSA